MPAGLDEIPPAHRLPVCATVGCVAWTSRGLSDGQLRSAKDREGQAATVWRSAGSLVRAYSCRSGACGEARSLELQNCFIQVVCPEADCAFYLRIHGLTMGSLAVARNPPTVQF